MSLNFIIERTEQYLNIIRSTIMQEQIRIYEIEYHEGRSAEGAWIPFVPDSYWGKNDTWYRFRTRFIIPEKYAGKCVKCHLRVGREHTGNSLNPQFLVCVNGHVVQALDTNHHEFLIQNPAQPGSVFELEFEAYAGREYDNQPFHDTPLQFILSAYCHEAAAEQLYYDLYAAKKALEMYPESNYYRICIENYVTEALNLIDLRVPSSASYFESVRAASAYMREEFYGKYCGHEEVIANCVGHTHIDVAWMWRLEQTRAKAVRSFSTELALLDEYPEHCFSSSQPQLYQFVKEDCPEVYEKIRERVKEGRWEVEGAMWLEADCNLSSGESLIRQILHGKRFMKEEFGVDSKVLWLPDVFGYSAALPQILKKTGVESFVTSKIHWSETNHFPYDTFLWKGIDGTEVFTQFITCGTGASPLGDPNMYSTYVGQILPLSQAKGWEIYQQKHINNEILVSFGIGDGGGGVTREMLEMNRRMCHGIPGVPKTRITTIKDALDRIKRKVAGKKIPKWFGELYLEFHRGTYTSMAKNKKYNRRSEFLMQSLEAVSLTDKLLNNGNYSKKQLYKDWTTILLNQFHDIIPGSSIREVYEDSEIQYLEILERNGRAFLETVNKLAAAVSKKGIFVYNPTGILRDGIIQISGKKYYVDQVPAFGWKVIEENSQTADSAKELSVSKMHMENRFYTIEFDRTGAMTSVFDKLRQREVLSGRGNVLEAYDDHPRDYDNWELRNYHTEKMWEIDDVSEITTEKDEVSVTLKIKRRFLKSVIIQKITIYRDMPNIDFDTEAEWQDHHIFVKAAFPVDVLSDKASYEIQYGAVERPTHKNTTWDAAKFEVCAHKWADYSEPGYGVALLNDCKYGHDIHDGVMRLSLIKCGTYPNPIADEGYHHFRYSLLPHAEGWREAGIVNAAYAFNCPLLAAATEGKGMLPWQYSLVSVQDSGILITVAKEACDSEAMIIRAYESQGKRCHTSIFIGMEICEASEVDMLENEVYESLIVKDNSFQTIFKPYEIKTFRVTTVEKSEETGGLTNEQ